MPVVVVKVAVAVDPSGKWNASGWSQADSSFPAGIDSMDAAVDGLGAGDGEARYWLTATLEVPEPKTVEAVVTKGE